MMKMRVYEVARDLSMDPKALVALFQAVGHSDVKNHMSAVAPEAVERIKRQLECLRSQHSIVLLVDRLQLGGFLVPGVGEIALARDRFHERLAFSSQALKVQITHGVSLRVR